MDQSETIDIEMPGAPPPAAPIPGDAVLGGDFGDIPIETLSIEDYIKKNQPPPKVVKKEPRVTSSKRRTEGVPVDNDTAPAHGVEVSRSIITLNTRDLNEYITKHFANIGIPEYLFSEESQSQFSIVLKFNHDGLQDIEPPYVLRDDSVDGKLLPQLFPSKKAAREFVAGLGLEYLKSLPPTTIAGLPASPNGGNSNQDTESFAGLLHRYLSKNKLPPPNFTDFQSTKPPALFGCEVNIALCPETAFGDKTPRYTGKKIARNVAAKAALEWIEAENPIPTTEPGNKSSAQALRVLAPGSVIQIEGKGKSFGQINNEILPKLGFLAIQFEFEKEPEMEGMWDVIALLTRPPNERFKIGPLKHQYGRQKAKEEMSKYILRHLSNFTRRHGMTLDVKGVDIDDIH